MGKDAKKDKKDKEEPDPTLMLPGDVRYQGKVKNGVPHGKGKLEWTNGDKFKGEFVGGKRHGKGKRKNADGSQYKGEYEDD